MKNRLLAIAIILPLTLALTHCVSQPTRYENTTETVTVTQAPAGYKKIRVALVNFRNLTGKDYIVEPATARLTGLMLQSGYFDVIEPSLVENLVAGQKEISPEKLQQLRDKFGAEYFLTGSLTNFEVREKSSGFCLLFGLLGAQKTREYIVEAAIDYRLVTTPEGKIADAGLVENRRTDTSRHAAFLFSSGGSDIRVLRSSSGKLLGYALRDMLEKIISRLPAR